MIPPRRLLLSGGGMKVVAIVGAIKTLQAKNALQSVKEVCGVSAGAWMAFMMACKTPIEVIERLTLELDFGIMRNLNVDTVMGFPEVFGLDDASKFTDLLGKIFRLVLKIDPLITFSGMKSDIAFRCWAIDLVTAEPREFSVHTTPNVKIIDALRASCALPFYFTPFPDPVTGNLLSDGGIQGGLPIQNLSDDEKRETLCIGFSQVSPANRLENPQHLGEFINYVLRSAIISNNDKILEEWNHHILRISIDYPVWNFEASREDREILMKKGSDAASIWLKAYHGSRISRRHSWAL
jgi:NTE family protein